MATRPTHLANPTDASAHREAIVEHFANAWHRGERPNLDEYLPADPNDRRMVLIELVHVELGFRIKAGEPVRVEFYLQRYPELAADSNIAIDLIVREFRLRRRDDPGLSATEYLQRFPQYRDEVRALLTAGDTQVAAESENVAPPPSTVAQTPEQMAETVKRFKESRLEVPGYEIVGELGRGGMGVVYLARDLRRDTLVALKTVQHASPRNLYRFKQEFRALADVVHPNLAALYELVAEGPVWFFTMEMIEGVTFREHVRGGAGDRRLRSALRQLAEGVSALHQAGKLHRDIKPSNVLVTSGERVVLLDFGLAAELDRTGSHQSSEGQVMGTVAYMAPEQGAGAAVSPASDWYSVGIMLYEALTGRLPFSGSPLAILRDKQLLDPPSPRALVPNLPDDLNDLCVELLYRDPAARPTGAEVLRRLAQGGETKDRLPHPPAKDALPFVGRKEPLAALTGAFATVRQGRPVTLSVQGRSGVGKTTLVHRFLETPEVAGEAVVLAGRCYERESVPYKALDSLVDALSRYLRRLPPAEVEPLLPREVGPLARLFPVLRQVETVASAPQRSAEIPDPQELRRRAFAALRELLARLGDRRPLILVIDDLQWGDIDSAALLIDLIRPPDAPVLLLLACFRSEEAMTSPCLQTLRASLDAVGQALDRRRLALEPLTIEEVRNLTRLLLGTDDHAEAIGRESGGNPFFVYELVQHLQARFAEPSSAAEAVTLDQVLWARVQRLPAEAGRLLEVIAVAGRPVAQTVACRAADLPGQERTASATLWAGRLIRNTDQEEVETYHDRVRETVVAHLAPEVLQEHHRRLAEAFEAAGQDDPEVLAIHWHGAKDLDCAGRYYSQAGDQATEALAFDRAAKLYRLALELRRVEKPEERSLRTKLGDALANGGRGAEAAEAYLSATDKTLPRESLELQRRAAEQLLRTGHLEEGLSVLTTILKAIGMSLPKSPVHALLSLVFRRFLLRLRGNQFQERPAVQVPPDELARIDICWSAAIGLSLIDPIIASDFQVRHLLLALRSGEPYRIALGLAMEVGYCALSGGHNRQRTEKLIEIANDLAKRIKRPHSLGLTMVWQGAAAWCMGNWRVTHEMSQRAESLFREQCTGVAWELTSSNIFALSALVWLGELKEHSLQLPTLLQEAHKRGDLYTQATLPLLTYSHNIWLAADQPEVARLKLRKAIEGWSHRGFHLQHFWELYGQAETGLYCSENDIAMELVRNQSSDVKRSMLLRIQTIYLFWLHLQARCDLAIAAHKNPPKAHDPKTQTWLRKAGKNVTRMEKEKMPWAMGLASLLQAGIAATGTEKPRATNLLKAAAADLGAADMRLYAAAARRRLGQMLGGNEGRDLIAQADAWMAGQGIVNPVRMTAMLAPGFPEPNS